MAASASPPAGPGPEAPGDAPREAIRWRLAWGVVALQTSLQLGWIIYRAWQPALLSRHGLAELLPAFLLLPTLAGLAIEPLAGWISDRWAAERRGRLLPISVAVLVAGLIFLTVVGLQARGIPQRSPLLPALMVAWMVAVQAASSPSLALLNDAASLRTLPRVAALVTLGHGLIGALEPRIARAALALGAGLTFLLGAAVLLIGLAILRQVPPPVSRPSSPLAVPEGLHSLPAASPVAVTALLLLLLGLSSGTLSAHLFAALPRWQPRLGEGGAAVVLLVSAAAAPWAGRLATRWGARRSLLLGIALLGGLLMLAPAVPQAAAAALLPLPGLLLGLLATSQTSVALASLPAGAGLGAGLVAGGSGAADALGIWSRRIPAGGTPAGEASSALVVAIASLVALGVTLLLPISPPEGHRAGRRNR